MKTEEEKRAAFLIGLTKLTRETGISIDGCGCCNSPFTSLLEPEKLANPFAKYVCDGYGGNVDWDTLTNFDN